LADQLLPIGSRRVRADTNCHITPADIAAVLVACRAILA